MDETAAAPQDDTDEPVDGHWLWGTLKRFMPYYRGAMLAALLSNVLMLVGGLFSMVVYDRVIPSFAYATLWALAGIVVLLVVFDFGLRVARARLLDRVSRDIDEESLAVPRHIEHRSLVARTGETPSETLKSRRSSRTPIEFVLYC